MAGGLRAASDADRYHNGHLHSLAHQHPHQHPHAGSAHPISQSFANLTAPEGELDGLTLYHAQPDPFSNYPSVAEFAQLHTNALAALDMAGIDAASVCPPDSCYSD